ncbi:hypothetical protein BMS3Bbin02_00783 [bacterium BMS3Bbin02]|nr:hypothetical protein BMS3Bbin02_00783 [bacterium BMS3Bbin02]
MLVSVTNTSMSAPDFAHPIVLTGASLTAAIRTPAGDEIHTTPRWERLDRNSSAFAAKYSSMSP